MIRNNDTRNVTLDSASRIFRGKVSISQMRYMACIFAICLLGFNFLLYSFFQVDFGKNILRIISGTILILCVIARRRFNAEILLLVVAMYMIAVGGSLTQNIVFILIAVLALDYDADYIWKRLSRYQIVGAGLVIICLVSGVVSNHVTSHLGRVRNTLGFVNVNAAALFFFSVIMLWLLEKEKVTWKTIIISIAATVLLYRITDTRTAVVALGVYLLGLIVLNRWNSKITCIGVCIFEGVLFSISQFSLAVFQRFPVLDITFSYRLSVFNKYINQNDLKTLIFGGTQVNDVDNFYLCLLYNGGILFYIFIMIVTIYATHFYFQNKQIKNVAFIISVLALGIMESGVIRCEIMSMLMFWYLIFKPLKKPISSYSVLNKNTGFQ